MPKKADASAGRKTATGRKKGAPGGGTAVGGAEAAEEMPRGGAGGRLRVTQVRSGIGHAATFRRTLRALGLKHHQDSVVVPDNPSIRGMIKKVEHLVKVEAVED
ncbi:50S ribosomal protein L30 [bacterium HR33]|nr:50S ribosomal protein L30 [bacterium HR33]